MMGNLIEVECLSKDIGCKLISVWWDVVRVLICYDEGLMGWLNDIWDGQYVKNEVVLL